MEIAILVLHVLAAVCVVVLVLIQQGKGADMGASFGAGASQTLFGSRGTGNVLTRATGILAAVFFVTSLALSVVAKNHAAQAGLVDMPVPAATEVPVAPTPAKSVDDVPTVEHNSAPAAGDVPSAPVAPQ